MLLCALAHPVIVGTPVNSVCFKEIRKFWHVSRNSGRQSFLDFSAQWQNWTNEKRIILLSRWNLKRWTYPPPGHTHLPGHTHPRDTQTPGQTHPEIDLPTPWKGHGTRDTPPHLVVPAIISFLSQRHKPHTRMRGMCQNTQKVQFIHSAITEAWKHLQLMYPHAFIEACMYVFATTVLWIQNSYVSYVLRSQPFAAIVMYIDNTHIFSIIFQLTER